MTSERGLTVDANAQVLPIRSDGEHLRAGLIGYGMAGRRFHAPLLHVEPRINLISVATSRQSEVETDWPGTSVVVDPMTMLSDDTLDLIIIATPNSTHAPLARLALEAGKHVVIDKPFATNAADARGLIELARARNRMLSVFHNRRWDSEFLSLARAIRAGRVGVVTAMESRMERFDPRVSPEALGRGPEAGFWMDVGPHLVDQALLLFGLPDAVSANLANQRHGAVADDWFQVTLDYGPARVLLHGSMVAAQPGARFTVHGTGGTLIKRDRDRQGMMMVSGKIPGGEDWGIDPDPLVLVDRHGVRIEIPADPGDQRLYYEGLAGALMDGTPNPVPPEQALAVMNVLEAAIASTRDEGRRITPDFLAVERAAYASIRPLPHA